MALDRRIVLEDSEICSPPEPQESITATPPTRPVVTVSTPIGTNVSSTPWKWPGTWQPILLPEAEHTHIIQSSGALDRAALSLATEKTPELTQFRDFNDYFNLGQIGLQPGLACKGCGSTSGFEPDFSMETFCCKTCGRRITFQMFQQEHP